MKRLITGLAIGLAALLAVGTARAENVWDGGGANANWDTPENWDDDTVPADTVDVTFATGLTSGTAISLNGNRTVNSLTLNTNATFSLNNNTLTLTSGNVTVTVGGNRDLNCNVDIGATDAVWDIGGTPNANGNVGLDIQGNLISSGSLTKTGTGTLLLNRSGGMSDLAGDVIVAQGQLSCRYQGWQLHYANSLTLSNATFYADAHGNNLPATGDIRLYSATLQNKNSGTRPNAIVLLGGNNTWDFAGASGALTGLISGGGAGTTFNVKNSTGTITLSNDNNDFTSKLLAQLWFYALEFTSVANAGVPSALGAATGADATISTEGNMTFRYIGTDPAGHATDRPFTTTQARPATIEASGVGPLTLNGTIYVHGGSDGGTLGGTGMGIANGKITVAGGGLRKNGTGIWLLSAPDNSIAGTSQVNAGTLRVNNASGSGLGSSPVEVNAGGTLGGSGSLTGAVTVKGGATLTAGATADSVGVLNLDNLTLEENATILCQYTDTANDRIDVTGILSLPVVATVVTANIEGRGYGDAVLISTSAPITADVSGWTVSGPLDKGEVVIQGNQLILKAPPKGSLILLR